MSPHAKKMLADKAKAKKKMTPGDRKKKEVLEEQARKDAIAQAQARERDRHVKKRRTFDVNEPLSGRSKAATKKVTDDLKAGAIAKLREEFREEEDSILAKDLPSLALPEILVPRLLPLLMNRIQVVLMVMKKRVLWMPFGLDVKLLLLNVVLLMNRIPLVISMRNRRVTHLCSLVFIKALDSSYC